MNLSSMEDKEIGIWFVKNKEQVINKKTFAYKVIKYLWDDAFKNDRNSYFNIDKYPKFEDIVNHLTNGANEPLDIFRKSNDFKD